MYLPELLKSKERRFNKRGDKFATELKELITKYGLEQGGLHHNPYCLLEGPSPLIPGVRTVTYLYAHLVDEIGDCEFRLEVVPWGKVSHYSNREADILYLTNTWRDREWPFKNAYYEWEFETSRRWLFTKDAPIAGPWGTQETVKIRQTEPAYLDLWLADMAKWKPYEDGYFNRIS